MGKDSDIQWTTHTYNPWRGCTKISAGCTNCYAETLSNRNPAVLGKWGPTGTRVVASEAKWREPLAWDRAAAKAGERHRVFCASLADVFEDWRGSMVDAKGNVLWYRSGKIVSAGATTPGCVYGERPATMDDVRDRLFSLIEATPNLDWLLLTKRPENIAPTCNRTGWSIKSNVWLGTTCENQEQADLRIPHLLRMPAAVRFLSVEPMLGPIDLRLEEWQQDGPNGSPYCQLTMAGQGISWVIVGGESGHHARPFDLACARDLRDHCAAAGVAFFMKQMGSKPVEWEMCGIAPGSISAAAIDSHLAMGGSEPDDVCHPLKLKDHHGGDMDEWPEDLKVRQFPQMEPTPS